MIEMLRQSEIEQMKNWQVDDLMRDPTRAAKKIQELAEQYEVLENSARNDLINLAMNADPCTYCAHNDSEEETDMCEFCSGADNFHWRYIHPWVTMEEALNRAKAEEKS